MGLNKMGNLGVNLFLGYFKIITAIKVINFKSKLAGGDSCDTDNQRMLFIGIAVLQLCIPINIDDISRFPFCQPIVNCRTCPFCFAI